MIIRSFDAASPSRKRLWIKVRRFVPRRFRWFYEGCIHIEGQLWYEERKLLYRTLREYKPENVFEVGTWLGVGSTYFIAQALFLNGRGKLYTIESDIDLYRSAVQSYHKYLAFLEPYVEFNLGDARDVYRALLVRSRRNNEFFKVDALFLDGAEDAKQTEGEFRLFEPFFHKGSVLMAHDWDNEKMAQLRPMIEGSSRWKVERALSAPKSVGFAVCRCISS